MNRVMIVCLSVALVAGVALAQNAQPTPAAPAQPVQVTAPAAQPAAPVVPAMAQPASLFTWGGDIRIREEYREDIQSPSRYAMGIFDYYRFRTRIWGEVAPLEDLALRARLCNEFRNWKKPDGFEDTAPQRSSSEWPDELVVDNLYVDVKNLFDQIDVRIGRQDLNYGSGKVICDGTAGDGSRTFYFNAVKASWRARSDTTIDLLALYNEAIDDWLTLNLTDDPIDRDVTGFPTVYGAREGVTESGGGIYVMNKTYKTMPVDLYYLFKSEEDYVVAKTTSQVDRLDVNTMGFRVTPKVGESLDGYLEAAVQFGDRGEQDVSGYMIDVGVTEKLPVAKTIAPTVFGYVYYLSGNDPETTDDEGWNPLWARFPQNSELYVYAYPVGWWSNVMMPTLGLSITPWKWLKTTASTSYMTAPEDDGPGISDVRGLLSVIKGEFTIKEGLLRAKDKLTAHLWLEMLEPGNYYANDETMYFARCQLWYNF